MLISEYQAILADIISHYNRTDLIVSAELATDARTPKIGKIFGSLTFADGARLFFTEYVDVRYRLVKLSYVYHCQAGDGSLIFRYDNAVHRPKLPYGCHKHLHTGEVIEAEPPELAAVIEEIMERFISC